MADIQCSLLVIIIDTNPVWWGQHFLQDNNQCDLFGCLDSILVFANSHLMMKHGNQLAIIASHTNQSYFLYPQGKTEEPVVTSDTNSETPTDEIGPRPSSDGRYELFTQVDEQITTQVKSLILGAEEGQLYSDCVVAGSLAMALCFIHRMEKQMHLGDKMSSRILVIKGSEDNPAQYMNFMNTVFSAQKQNVVMDGCILGKDSSLMQQACDITGGTYLKLPSINGLLQYLLCVFLPDPDVRHKFILPARVQVDYRAACFCHRNLIDIGYVCSVCLSIFCSFSPICSTCQTTFKFLGPPKILKKKMKKAVM